MATSWSSFFFFNDTATTEIYTLSLHDALPIYSTTEDLLRWEQGLFGGKLLSPASLKKRSEEHTSELQSQSNLVCRLLLEKKKKTLNIMSRTHAPDYLDTLLSHKSQQTQLRHPI